MTTSIGSVPPPGPLSYTGAVFIQFITRTFDPQTTFNTFQIGTVWLNTASNIAFMLVSKANGVAIWARIGGAPGEIDTITTPDSVVVVPTAGNVNFTQSGAINITGSGSTVNFAVTGGAIMWHEVTATTQQMAVDSGYIANNAMNVTLTLPTTAAQGSIIEVAGKGSGGWTIAQNAGQTIYFGSVTTTPGAGGSLASTNQRDCIRLLCITADTEFEVLSVQGNITYV